MFIFLSILLLCICICISYYFTSKISVLHRQLIVLSRQNSSLKNKLIAQNSSEQNQNNIQIKYRIPNYKYATTIENSELHISPINNSIVINKLAKGTMLEIQDSAQVSNYLWYEISVPSEERINTKGWIISSNISLLEEKSF